MTPDPLTVSPSDDLADALEAMRDRGFRHLPVVEDGEILGILSERDIVRLPLFVEDDDDLGEAEERADWLRTTKVEAGYVRSPETIDEDAPLAEAARILLDNKIGCVLVTRSAELVGILTEADFVRHVMDRLESDGLAAVGDTWSPRPTEDAR
jgi:CBS domain-containing protein